MILSDSIVRFLGADPAVYKPMARAYARILSRRTRLARGAGRVFTKGITPFQFRCFMYAVFSLIMLPWIIGSASPIFGVALVLTVGAGFLLLDLLFDKFDVLADPNEYQVIAAHPHDAWSIILAKLVAIGRSTAALAACTFVIPAVAVGVAFHSIAAGLAFAVAAAAMSVAVSTGGMLASALIVAAGGRAALLRFLPLAHVIYLILSFGVIGARELLARVSVPQLDALGWIQWAVPTLWFAAPVELVTGHGTPSTAVRGLLALASFGVLLPISGRWVRTRFDERILEPVLRASRVVTPTRTRVEPSERVGKRAERWIGLHLFWRVLVAHLRSDTTVRGGLITALVLPALVITSQVLTMGKEIRPMGVVAMSITWLIFAETLLTRWGTMSSRPSAIWFVLAAPRSRVPYTRALEAAVRLILLLPGVALATGYSILFGSGPVVIRIALIALMALLGECALLTLRIMTPDLPFSLPIRSKRPFSWTTVLIGGAMLVLYGVLLASTILLGRWNPVASLIPVACALVVRIPLGFWEGWRIEKTARDAELVQASA